MSRQGLRRFRALQPSTAFHDSFHPSDAKYVQIVLGSNSRRPPAERRFDKLGVCRTVKSGAIDAEFASLSDLIEYTKTEVQVSPAFLEQFGARLRRDCDILNVDDLVSILSLYVSSDYLDIGLMNKLGKEILFDIAKLSLSQLGVVAHAFAYFRVSLPKLERAMQSVGEISSGDDLTGLLLLIVHLSKPDAQLRKTLEKADQGFFENLEIGFAISAMQKMAKKTPKNLIQYINTITPLPDIKTCARMYELGVDRPDLAAKLEELAPDVLGVATGELTLEYIARRNEAAGIAASVLIACKSPSLRKAYEPLLSNPELLKGLRTHHLVGLAKEGAFVEKEIKRKFNSFSHRQKNITCS